MVRSARLEMNKLMVQVNGAMGPLCLHLGPFASYLQASDEGPEAGIHYAIQDGKR